MAKRQPQQTVVRSFDIDGITYTDGDRLQIITPELGLLTLALRFEDYSNPELITMNLGLVTTPLPCRIGGGGAEGNARMKLSITRMPPVGSQPAHISNRLSLIYFCLCHTSKHSDQLSWYDVSFELGVARSTRQATDTNDKWRRIRHPLVEGWRDLQPTTFDELKQTPIHTDKKGQLNLF